jgi:hypothetical protein
LGVQCPIDKQPVLKRGTQEWLDVLVQNNINYNNPIFVRGNKTYTYLNELYKNVTIIPIGCPSQVLINSIQTTTTKENNRSEKLLFSSPVISWSFTDQITKEIISTINECDLNEDEHVQALESSIDVLSKRLIAIGITESTITMAQKNISLMKKNVQNNKKLSQLLERLVKNQSSYMFTHTQICTYVALHIIKNIDWGNPEQEDKIIFICFLLFLTTKFLRRLTFA